jgi:hypothetical protein
VEKVVARILAKTRNRFFMAGELRKNGFWEQGDQRPDFKLK